MQTPNQADTRYHAEGRSATRLLLLVFVGLAFVLNAYLARFVYPDNALVGDVSALIGALILAAPIFRTAVVDLFRGRLRMNELVALAVLATMVQGDFRTAGVVAFFMLISQVIEMRTAEGAHAAIESLIRLTPSTARRISEEGGEGEVAATALRVGDRLRVLPGEDVPADGTIASGRTTLNEANVTGESLPRDKGPEEEVFAGTQNLTGAVELTVTRVGSDTTIGRVRELILAAEKTRLPIMMVIDRYIGYYTPVVVMLAGLVWFFSSDWEHVISFLVIACPSAVVLATPTAMVAALSAAARLGILVKNVTDLEAAGRITAAVFDKTGTLTTGNLGVSRLAPREGIAASELLRTAAGTAQFSNHPAAQAMVALAREAEVDLPPAEDIHEEAGLGMRGTVDGESVLIGRVSWLQENGVSADQFEAESLAETEGLSVICVARQGHLVGWVGLQDQVRDEAKGCIEALKELNVKRLAMVSGDRASVAEKVANAVGLSEFQAECLPEGKVDFVNRVRSDGYRVAVVGDGVNDAPALAAGDTGIAMGAAGSDAAIHSASVALMNNDLRRLPFLIRLSREAKGVIHQNLGVGILFIAGGLVLLFAVGKLNPITASMLHLAGSLVVVFNSARLIRSGDELEQELPSLEAAAEHVAPTALESAT